jgi:hypothetical protein
MLVFVLRLSNAIIFPTVIEAIEMITMISWNAGEISAFMIVSNLNKVAIATTLPMCSLRQWSVGALHKHQAPKMERYCCNFKKHSDSN